MRRSVLLILGMLLPGPASRAEDAAKPATSPREEIASFSLPGFDLTSVKTFDFAPDTGSRLVDLTMTLVRPGGYESEAACALSHATIGRHRGAYPAAQARQRLVTARP